MCTESGFIDCSDGDVRLVGGRHSYEGFVEICMDSIWTLVAQSGWDNSDARIVCKQLKFDNHYSKFCVVLLNSSLLHL